VRGKAIKRPEHLGSSVNKRYDIEVDVLHSLCLLKVILPFKVVRLICSSGEAADGDQENRGSTGSQSSSANSGPSSR
jgi:hypothetical protein